MIIDEIIQLKKAKGIDFEETYAQQLRHYKGALRHGVLEYIVDGGVVVGFIEWVRLPRPPEKRDFGWADYPVQKGPYLYIINAVSSSIGVSRGLKKLMDRKNKSAEFYCYHDKQGKLIVKGRKNAKRVYGKDNM